MLIRLVLAGALVLIAHGVVFAQLVEVEGRYWLVDVDGSVKVKSGPLPATKIDLADDLHLKEAGVPDVRVSVSTGLMGRVRAAYAHFDFDHDTTLARTIQFSRSTFSLNTAVESELELHYGRIGWIWQPLTIPGILKVGPVLEAKGFVGDVTLRTRGVTPPIKESHTFALALPTAGLALDVTPFRMLHLFAEASGLPAGGLGHFVDAEAGLKFEPLPFLALTAGYRVVDLQIDYQSNFANVRLSGPAFGVAVRFP